MCAHACDYSSCYFEYSKLNSSNRIPNYWASAWQKHRAAPPVALVTVDSHNEARAVCWGRRQARNILGKFCREHHSAISALAPARAFPAIQSPYREANYREPPAQWRSIRHQRCPCSPTRFDWPPASSRGLRRAAARLRCPPATCWSRWWCSVCVRTMLCRCREWNREWCAPQCRCRPQFQNCMHHTIRLWIGNYH